MVERVFQAAMINRTTNASVVLEHAKTLAQKEKTRAPIVRFEAIYERKEISKRAQQSIILVLLSPPLSSPNS